MFHRPSLSPRKRWITAAACMAALCGHASAQNFTMRVADSNPLNIGGFIPGAGETLPDLSELTDGIKGSAIYGLDTEAAYNSNLFLTETKEESDLSFFFTPWIRYISDPEGGAPFSFNVNYNPVARVYMENSDLNGFDQTGDVMVTFRGGKTEITLFGLYNELSGTDRITGDFVEGSLMTAGIRAARQLAPRTSLNAGFSAAMSDYGNSTDEGSDIYTTYLGAMWDASQKLSIGNTLRHTLSESDNIGNYEAIALLFEARYKLGERILLSASVGPELGQGEDNDSTVRFTGDLNMRYAINERLTWVNSLRSATVPSPDETNYMVYDVRVATTLERQFVRGWLATGLEYNLSAYEDVGTVATNRGDEQNLSVFITYRRNLLSERVNFDSTVRYSFNDGLVDWDQWMVSMGVNVLF